MTTETLQQISCGISTGGPVAARQLPGRPLRGAACGGLPVKRSWDAAGGSAKSFGRMGRWNLTLTFPWNRGWCTAGPRGHRGWGRAGPGGAGGPPLGPPLTLTSVYVSQDEPGDGPGYGRNGNPGWTAVESALAALEGGGARGRS